jgi:hypothetical protein
MAKKKISSGGKAEASGSNYETLVATWYAHSALLGAAAQPPFDLPADTLLGQFKRGKSTFINALLGAPLLPMAVVPLTAVPIFISWRSSPSVCVRFADGRPAQELSADNPDAIREFLFRFVAEEANPKNTLRVDRVEVFYPAPVLADNTVLIDTPGVGSTFRHNTEAALQVLAECDAAVLHQQNSRHAEAGTGHLAPALVRRLREPCVRLSCRGPVSACS